MAIPTQEFSSDLGYEVIEEWWIDIRGKELDAFFIINEGAMCDYIAELLEDDVDFKELAFKLMYECLTEQDCYKKSEKNLIKLKQLFDNIHKEDIYLEIPTIIKLDISELDKN